MRHVSWRWAGPAAALAIALYVAAGVHWGARADGNLLYNIGSVTACTAALAFIAIYTAIGVRGPAKWWQSDLGVLLVTAVAATLPTLGTITYAVLFHGGLVNTLPLAWTLIGGTYVWALTWLYLSWVIIRINRGNGKEE